LRTLVHREPGDIEIIEEYFAFIGLDQSNRHIESGGLAGAVGTKQSNNLTLLYLDRYMVHYRAGAVTFHKLGGMYDNAQWEILVKILGNRLPYEGIGWFCISLTAKFAAW